MIEKAKVHIGDCTKIIPTLGKFDFIFADPPFNIGHGYNGFDDNKEREEFDSFNEAWVEACWNACDGVLALHGPDDLVETYLVVARKLKMKRIAWVNWHYRFGQCGRSNWIDARCHCLVYAKHEKWTWNPDEVLVESDRVSYGDKRVNETSRGGKRLPGTVWGIPSDGKYWGRVQGNSKERRKNTPNQLPEVYLERLIRAYTNAGDRILDPFCGSGTTATVGTALNRICETIDISLGTASSAIERITKGTVRIKPNLEPLLGEPNV